MTHRFPAILAAITLAGASPPSALADPAAIDAAAAAFAGSDVTLAPLDRRLRLAACNAPPQIEWYGSGRTALKVACPDRGWRVFLAVRGNAPSAGAQAIVIARGEAISVEISGAGFAVHRQGEALDPGARGASIRVRLAGAESRAPLRAEVLGPGLAGIVLP